MRSCLKMMSWFSTHGIWTASAPSNECNVNTPSSPETKYIMPSLRRLQKAKWFDKSCADIEACASCACTNSSSSSAAHRPCNIPFVRLDAVKPNNGLAGITKSATSCRSESTASKPRSSSINTEPDPRKSPPLTTSANQAILLPAGSRPMNTFSNSATGRSHLATSSAPLAASRRSERLLVICTRQNPFRVKASMTSCRKSPSL
mmetsp:Transcript_43731/g.126343  ORF Transcript_43731/g.126343 Transcript_43731/m.126343 type:complete len:204 (-) Transcript_43731:169-780(-)